MPGHVIVAGHGHVCEQPAKLRGISPPAQTVCVCGLHCRS